MFGDLADEYGGDSANCKADDDDAEQEEDALDDNEQSEGLMQMLEKPHM